ncbi:MAG: hypothetical protein IJ196_02080 [Prevotella sp.]|nr:hypothetical protein [Prevotella sp.]
MKKIFTLVFALMTFVVMQAEEKVVWEGEQAISWNAEAAPGIQFETPEGIFAGLEKGNVIRVYTTTTYDDPQYVLTYKKGDGWDWTDLSITTDNSIMAYTVEDETVGTEISERGLIVRGQAYTITKITVDSEDGDEPQPVEGEKTLWEGTQEISWNNEVAPGIQFETPEGIFAGLEKGDVIRVYTTTTYEDPQYVLTYKKGDGWDWTDLSVTVDNGVIAYTVEDETVATEIAERGLIVRGQAYTMTKITLAKGGLDNISSLPAESAGERVAYNLGGQRVGNGYRGIAIINGKKIYVK